MDKINAGVTVMQDFCRPGSDTFKGYIDYLDREEAQRNNAITTFNLFNDYMGNPYKSTGLFTADKDMLTFQEKKELKAVFDVAQKNESVLWQTVISFDNQWLEKNGVYHREDKVLDERKIKEAARLAMSRLLTSEELNHAVWSAGIHYNTDNIHVHVAIVEPSPMREKMLYQGNLEVRGKFKMSSINKCRSTVVNELMQTREINQKINFILRQDIVGKLKEHELSNDVVLREKFLNLCQKLPKGNVNYNNRSVTPFRKQVDEISRLFLKNYCPEKEKEFIEIVERQSRLYAEAYGGGNEFGYKEDKQYEMMERMGNAVLKSAKAYVKKLEENVKETEIQSTKVYGTEKRNDVKPDETISFEMEMEQTKEITVEEREPEGISDWETTAEPERREAEEHTLELKKEKSKEEKKAIYREIEEWERDAEKRKEEKPEHVPKETAKLEQYQEWFNEFRDLRAEVTDCLKAEGQMPTEKTIERLHGKATENPFVQGLLGEMYLQGKLVDISLERAEEYFKEALETFEEDVYHIEKPEKGMDFTSYLEYRIGKHYARGWGAEYDPEVAADWFAASETGYAAYSLGNLYFAGEGVEQNYEKAFRLYERSIQISKKHGQDSNPFATLKCAQMYELGLGTEQNSEKSKQFYEEAFEQFRRAEEKGPDALFEYQLGNMYYHGKGCEKDEEKAIEYLKEAVKQKNVSATLLLSSIYNEQKMTEPMPELIAELEKLAEAGNNEMAQYTLGNIYTNDWEFYDLQKGVDKYKKAAEQGNQYAQYKLGKLYIDPQLEIYDLQKGIAYLEQSAEQENQYAQYTLGKLYTDPQLEIYDLQKGIGYLEQSAGQGNQYAQLLLGKLYTNPDIPIYDLKKGIAYLEGLEEWENPYVQYQLGKLYINPDLGVYDPQKGKKYLEESCAQGNEAAKYLLGREYLNKESVFYDAEKGIRYIKELAEAGHEYAQLKLGVEYIKGEHVQKNLSEARKWLGRSAEQGNEFSKKLLQDMTTNPRSGAVRRSRGNPMGELDKALAELRRAMYEAQAETRKNLMMYEMDLEEEIQNNKSLYI